jgi:hypothetical protein
MSLATVRISTPATDQPAGKRMSEAMPRKVAIPKMWLAVSGFSWTTHYTETTTVLPTMHPEPLGGTSAGRYTD